MQSHAGRGAHAAVLGGADQRWLDGLVARADAVHRGIFRAPFAGDGEEGRRGVVVVGPFDQCRLHVERGGSECEDLGVLRHCWEGGVLTGGNWIQLDSREIWSAMTFEMLSSPLSRGGFTDLYSRAGVEILTIHFLCWKGTSSLGSAMLRPYQSRSIPSSFRCSDTPRQGTRPFPSCAPRIALWLVSQVRAVGGLRV